jgi:hypothetical protein
VAVGRILHFALGTFRTRHYSPRVRYVHQNLIYAAETANWRVQKLILRPVAE